MVAGDADEPEDTDDADVEESDAEDAGRSLDDIDVDVTEMVSLWSRMF